MNKINKKALLFSLILTVISGFFLFTYIRSYQTPVEQKPKTGILTSVREILPGEIILATDIQTVEVTNDSVPIGILTNREEIENMVATELILAGEPFREDRITTGDMMNLAWNIPEGKRAITVFVNEAAVFANMIRVGDRIDLISTFEASQEEPDKAYLKNTTYLVQNVEVAAIGSDRYNTMEKTLAAGEVVATPSTLTLLVDPEQAEKIIFTSAYGTYSFVLRGHGDETIVDLPGIITSDIMPENALTDSLAGVGAASVGVPAPEGGTLK